MATDPLLQPFQLKHLTLKNRIMSTSHEPAYAEDALPKLRYQLYHEEKAKGGLALTMFGGSTNVDKDSPAAFGQLFAGSDEIIPYFQQLAERVHRHGAYTMVQLTHMGRRTIWDAENWLPTVAPSMVREPAHRSFPKTLEHADIKRIVRAFGQAARRAKEGGLDGVEIIAYGHLVDQFWTPLVNQRTDEYGGSIDNRMRFSREVFEEVRSQVGDDFIVGIRMSGNENREGGLTQEDCTYIATTLAASGVIDFVNIIKGFIASDEAISHVIPGFGTPLGPHIPLAAAIKEAVNLPVFHAARINDLATARHAINEGLLDMVGMTRAHMADPYIVKKLERGEEDRIRLCVGASYCLNRLYTGADALCIQNPATGREETMPHVIERSEGLKKKVVIVGAGVAGLEAARVSAERGHEVVLFEAMHEPGGQVQLLARANERRQEMIGIVDWLVSEIGHLGVDLRLNTYADAATITAKDPDIVVIATGGFPNTSFLDKGEELVTTIWDVIAGNSTPIGSVLLFDDHGSEHALSCAERLATNPDVQLELVTPDRLVGHEVIGTAYPSYLKTFYENNVTMTPNLRLVSVTQHPDGFAATLHNEYTDDLTERIVDAVIIEHGTLPLDDVYFDLKDGSTNLGEIDIDALIDGRPQDLLANPDGTFQLFRIGDAVSGRNIHAAMYDALRLAKEF
ncbi:MAG: NADH:flavin oxidoreductase [Acidimicrobiia bacterium]|nr:NADH:flavin oxidoreductase [Acidimicrobiia bacterium]NNL28192.1 NADH:flavin oxidoreductase [Acidimicrobiia bacterium]